MSDSTQYQRPNIAAMAGYVWGEQPQDAQTIKLNTNENPYPPSPKVEEALTTLSAGSLRRYPEPTARAMREELAKLHGLTPEHFLLSNGGDEGLRLALTTFVDPKQTFAMLEPSYSLYEVLAAIQDTEVEHVPYGDSWQIPEALSATVARSDVRLTCVVNPHAPSGTLYSVAELEALAQVATGVLLIDEAYVDFVDPARVHSTMELVERYNNVLILRSFSKGYGLAGLRLGYLIGAPSLIEPIMWKTRDSYNLNHITQIVGLAALQDQSYAKHTWHQVRAERERLSAALANLRFTAPPSETNFLLVSCPGGRETASTLYQHLKAQHILVRYFDKSGLDDKLRISVGTEVENETLLQKIKEYLS